MVNYNWRWIFLINVPVGLMALTFAYFLVDDPVYLKEQRAKLRGQPLNFDYIGLGLLALVMACWEIMLSKGQEWDWLGDPFGRIQTLMALFGLGLGFLIFRQLRIKNPIINFRVLGERNLAMSCIILASAYAVLYASSFSLPNLLQALFGYDAFHAGLVLSPGGITSISALLVAGFLLGRAVDARWLIAAGLLVVAAANYWMSLLNLQVSPTQVVGPRMGLTLGLGLIFAPHQRGRLQVHSRASARGRGGLARPVAQRGGQRRHVDGPNHPRAPRAVSFTAAGRASRST